MIDPITAIGIASTAFSTIKKAISTGKEIHEVTGQLGKFFSAASELNKIEKPKASIFKKLLDKGSIEKEALDMIIHKKKLQEMEKELYELIVYTYGPETYREMIQMRKKIREDREKEFLDQQKRRKEALENTFYIVCILLLGSMAVWGISLMIQFLR